MSNVLKVEFKEHYLTSHTAKELLANFKTELLKEDFKTILDKLKDSKDLLWATIEYMSDYNVDWPFDSIPLGTFRVFEWISTSKLTNIIIPESVKKIENYAFEYCKTLTSITIPNSITKIGDHTFWNCTSLKNVNMSDNIKSIGSSAFSNCNSLTSITLPNSVKDIGTYAFFDCPNLTIETNNDYVIDYCKQYKIKYKNI